MKCNPLFKWFGSKWQSAKRYPSPLHINIVEKDNSIITLYLAVIVWALVLLSFLHTLDTEPYQKPEVLQ